MVMLKKLQKKNILKKLDEMVTIIHIRYLQKEKMY